MKFIFRGNIIFEYVLPTKTASGYVFQHSIHGVIAAFDYCTMIPEDYKLLSQFFDTVYRHLQGKDVELIDIEIN